MTAQSGDRRTPCFANVYIGFLGSDSSARGRRCTVFFIDFLQDSKVMVVRIIDTWGRIGQSVDSSLERQSATVLLALLSLSMFRLGHIIIIIIIIIFLLRSAAVTAYDAGPRLEPWIMLADITPYGKGYTMLYKVAYSFTVTLSLWLCLRGLRNNF